MDINNVTDVRCHHTKDARRWSGNWAAQRGAWKLPLVEREHLSISQFFHTTKPKSRRGILGFEDFVRGLQRSGNLKWHRKMTCKMNSEKVWKSMEKFNLLKVSISSCNSAVPLINVISCTGTTMMTKDWISGWRFRRQNFESSNPAWFEAFWPVACWRMWIQGSSRSFPTPWPLWVSCQDVQNATFWEFQCSTPTDSNDQGEVLCLWKKLPDLQMPKSAGLDVVVGYVNKGSGAGWEREQIVTFVFFTMSGSVIEWYWCISAPPKVVWCKHYSEEMWFVSPQPFIRTSCKRVNKLVTGGVFQATASKGALAVSWLTYWRQGLMLSWSGMWDWDWFDHLDHLDMIFKHD